MVKAPILRFLDRSSPASAFQSGIDRPLHLAWSPECALALNYDPCSVSRAACKVATLLAVRTSTHEPSKLRTQNPPKP